MRYLLEKHVKKLSEESLPKNVPSKDSQIAYIAINKTGKEELYHIHEDFILMKYQDDENICIKSGFCHRFGNPNVHPPSYF